MRKRLKFFFFSTLHFQICIFGLVTGKHCQNNLAVLSCWCPVLCRWRSHARTRLRDVSFLFWRLLSYLRLMWTNLPAAIMKNSLQPGTQNSLLLSASWVQKVNSTSDKREGCWAHVIVVDMETFFKNQWKRVRADWENMWPFHMC